MLDDPVWRRPPVALQSAQHDDGDWPAEVRLAYDAEFLIAVRCREAPAEAPHESSRTDVPQNDPVGNALRGVPGAAKDGLYSKFQKHAQSGQLRDGTRKDAPAEAIHQNTKPMA